MMAKTIRHLNTFQQRCLRHPENHVLRSGDQWRSASPDVNLPIGANRGWASDALRRTCSPTATNQAPTNGHNLEPATRETEARMPQDHVAKDIHWRPQSGQPFLGWSRNCRSQSNTMEVDCRPMRQTAREDLSVSK